ncbi:MAG: hypothetical protein ACI4M9_05150 [Succinivibrio sp.]
MSYEIKPVQMPARDTILSTNEVMENTPDKTPLLFDLTLTTEQSIIKTSKDLSYFEEFLWKTLILGGAKANNRIRDHLQKVFNVSNDFMKYVREVPLQNLSSLCETMFLSFAPPVKLQKEIVNQFSFWGDENTHYDCTQIDLNARKTDLLLWQQYINLIKDKNDRLNLIPLRLGLTDEFFELFQKFSSNDIYCSFIKQGHFSLKLRCPEETIFTILVEENNKKLEDLKRLKTRQVLSFSEAEYQKILSKTK